MVINHDSTEMILYVLSMLSIDADDFCDAEETFALCPLRFRVPVCIFLPRDAMLARYMSISETPNIYLLLTCCRSVCMRLSVCK